MESNASLSGDFPAIISIVETAPYFLIYILLKERERKEKNLNSHSYIVYLQLRYIYIYKARSPNYHTCDLY